MNAHRTTRTLAALVALSFAVSPALATDIYKWTDENGVVHFGDRPSGVPAERVVLVQSDTTRPPQARAPVQPSTPEATTAATAPPGAQPALTEEQLAAQEQQRAERCAMLKERLQLFLTSRRLYREDESGERTYLNEEETLAARAKVQQEIIEYCE